MALKYDMRVWNGIILWNDRANNNEQILKKQPHSQVQFA